VDYKLVHNVIFKRLWGANHKSEHLWIKIAFCSFVLCFLFLTHLPETQAAVLNSVQYGTVSLPADQSSITDTLSPTVDMSKSFLVFGISGSFNAPTNGQVTGQITANDTVTFQRDAGAGAPAITIKWYVAEFSSGVSVQRGTKQMPGAASPADDFVTLGQSIDTGKTVPIISYRTNGGTYDTGDFLRAKITDSTTLWFYQNDADTAAYVEWQVVEFTDATSTTASMTSVDTSKAWLIYTYDQNTGGADIGNKLVRGRITANNELTFDRDNTGSTINLTWYVVEFTDGTTVQHNTEDFTTAQTQQDVTITSVDLNSSIAAGGYFMRSGKSPYSADDDPGVGWFNLDLTSATNLRITRGTTGSATADVGWFVIQFPASNSSPNNPTINDHNDGSTISDNTPTLGFTQSDPDTSEQVKYRIQIDATDNNFSNLVVDYTSALMAEGATNFTVGQAAGSGTYTVGSAGQTLADGDYFWRVMTTDDESAASGWTQATTGSNIAFTVVAPTGDFNFKQGTFTKIGTTATQAVHVGFQAKALIFYWVNNNSGLGDDINSGFGFVDDSVNQRAIGFGHIDNKGSSSIKQITKQSRNRCILITDAAGASVVAEAQLSLFAVDGFTLNWTVNDGNTQTIHYIALGGSDITNVQAGDFGTGGGTQDYTMVGFEPDFLMFMSVVSNSWETASTTSAEANIGFATSSTEEGGIGVSFAYGSGLPAKVRQRTDNSIVSLKFDGTEASLGHLNTFLSNGFRIDYTATYLVSCSYLAIKGGAYKVGSFNKKSDGTGTQTISDVGFQPSGLILASSNQNTNAAIQSDARISFGASDGTNERAIWFDDIDGGSGGGGTKTVTDYDQSTTKVAYHATTVNDSPPTLDAAADLSEFNGSGFNLNWTTNNSDQDEIIYVAFATSNPPAGGPFDFRKSITIDRTKIPGACGTTLPDFPMLFSVTDGDLATTGNGGDVASYDAPSNDPRDIIFRALDDDTCGGPGTAPCTLDHEIEKYVDTTGELAAWVRIPSANTNSAGSDTVIYIYYGNAGLTESTANPTGVWNDGGNNYFKGVWHLREASGGSGAIKDSTSFVNHGTDSGAPIFGATGKIGGAIEFDGSNDVIRIDNSNGAGHELDFTAGPFTISAWINTQSANTHIAGKRDGDLDQYQFGVGNFPTLFFRAGGEEGWQTSPPNLSYNTWYYAAVVVDASEWPEIYLDGTQQPWTDASGDSRPHTFTHRDVDLSIGARWATDPTTAAHFDGFIDEVRVSSTARSSCWLGAEYSNQKWPNKNDFPTNGFLSLGSEESNPPTAIGLISFTATGDGNDVEVVWETGHEIANLGFNIYRATNKDGPFKKINSALIPGLNYSVEGKAYSFMDTDVRIGTLYYYKLEDIDAYGTTASTPSTVPYAWTGMATGWPMTGRLGSGSICG
jgi:hypothetical protein